jgi:CelD/BcsL family acetyltransferase involved in cellulose biosynthesis
VPHPSLAPEQFPAATARRRETVALPVHQELSIADVERIARAVRPRRKHGPGLRLEPIDSLESVRPQWTELARRSRNIFATWEWATSWWRHHGIGHALQAFACRSADGGSPVAILPLYLSSSGRLRVVRFIGHGPADQTGPICAPEDRRTVARLMRRLLSDRRGDWDLFLGEQLPRDERWGELLHARVLRREGNPVLRAPGGWEEYLASRSANLRQQMRRRERALAREHELRYRLADDPDRLQADIDTLFALHADRWDGHESRFIAADQAFHREFARHALEQGWLRLWFLELDGCPRAAWYGFRFQGVESYYQAGRDPTWQTRSVGFVLLAHSIRAALQDGVREYRFLRGSEPFKYRFADFDPELETVAVAHGPRGAAALATLAAGVGQAAARRRLAR